jgi:ABC-type transport system substrate-binding protein
MMNNRRKAVGLTMALAFLFMAVSPVMIRAETGTSDWSKAGPYVDKIVFDVIQSQDQTVVALLDGEIDLIGSQVDPSFLPQLEETENIEIADVLRNGYGYVTLNTRKYPLNETGLRRAIAFALDKQAVSDDIWDGLSVPQDSPVPQVNPFSIEDQMTYHYYEANIEKGNDLLDAAGFQDTDDDGFREAPNGEDFDILVECAQSSEIAIEVGQKVADALEALSVEAESVPTDFYEYLNRLYYHGDYDIVFLGSNFNDFDVDWLAYEFWSEYTDEPLWNFANFANDSYDSWRDQLLHATEYDDVYEAAIEMQRILTYQVPYIICYENTVLSAYRTDRFEGFINDVSDGVPGWWTNMKVHLKDSEGGPYGGTFSWSNSLDIDTFNLMVTSSQYSVNILQMMYDKLIDVDSEGHDVPDLAESWTVETHDDNADIPDGYTRITFNMLQNATWTDGNPITAEDAAFTLNYYRDSPGNPSGSGLDEMTAAYAPTPYTLEVEFSTES